MALQAFMDRCDQILAAIKGKSQLRPYERAAVAALYRSLKDDIRAEKERMARRRTQHTSAEVRFLRDAVRRALIELRPQPNWEPLSFGLAPGCDGGRGRLVNGFEECGATSSVPMARPRLTYMDWR